VFPKKVLPGIVKPDIHVLPVVEPSPFQVFVVDFESQRSHKMKRRIGGGAETRDAPGVGRYLGFD
jgi:hypothetical protein